MPFKSERQRRYLWMKHPEIARRWTEKYGAKVMEKHMVAAKKKRMNDER